MNWQFDWQDVLAIGVTLAAAWYLVRRLVGVVRRDPVTGCGTCAGCGSDAKREVGRKIEMVPIDSLRDSAR